MSTDGGGWIGLQLDDAQQVLVASYSSSNPWHKCADNSADPYGWLSDENAITEDYFGSQVNTVLLDYLNPATGLLFTADELDQLRLHAAALAPSTRLVGTTADADGGDYLTDGYGHEVWLYDTDGNLFEATPGTSQECGGSSGWPAGGSAMEKYFWSTDADEGEAFGDTGGFITADMTALPRPLLIPDSADLVVATGGGVSFGWEQQTFLIR